VSKTTVVFSFGERAAPITRELVKDGAFEKRVCTLTQFYANLKGIQCQSHLAGELFANKFPEAVTV